MPYMVSCIYLYFLELSICRDRRTESNNEQCVEKRCRKQHTPEYNFIGYERACLVTVDSISLFFHFNIYIFVSFLFFLLFWNINRVAFLLFSIFFFFHQTVEFTVEGIKEITFLSFRKSTQT